MFLAKKRIQLDPGPFLLPLPHPGQLVPLSYTEERVDRSDLVPGQVQDNVGRVIMTLTEDDFT
jgi:hypothetical protein